MFSLRLIVCVRLGDISVYNNISKIVQRKIV